MTMPGADPLVSLRDVSKHFGEGETRVDALRAVSIDVFPGEVVALLGPSGSGKTTLLNVIGCILEPASGRMALAGETVYDGRWLKGDLRRLRLDKIGFIFQFHNLLPFLDAADNVGLVLELAGAGAAAARLALGELARQPGAAPGGAVDVAVDGLGADPVVQSLPFHPPRDLLRSPGTVRLGSSHP